MGDKHLSTQFDSELNALSSRVMEMGGLVEAQIGGHRLAAGQDAQAQVVVVALEPVDLLVGVQGVPGQVRVPLHQGGDALGDHRFHPPGHEEDPLAQLVQLPLVLPVRMLG